jgi:hypothetical protein
MDDAPLKMILGQGFFRRITNERPLSRLTVNINLLRLHLLMCDERLNQGPSLQHTQSLGGRWGCGMSSEMRLSSQNNRVISQLFFKSMTRIIKNKQPFTHHTITPWS